MKTQDKEVVINDRRYCLQKMSPLIAVRILNWLVSISTMATQSRVASTEETPSEAFNKLTPEEKANETISFFWVTSVGSMTEEMQEKIQMHCLRAISSFPEGSEVAVPVMTQNGRWTDKELESDPLAINQLMMHSLKFNLAPFFSEDASNNQTTTRP